MSIIFYKNALKKLKKADVARKQRLATDSGFKSPEEYENFLISKINASIEAPVTTTKKKLLQIDLLDNSGSMRGNKDSNSRKGIKEGFLMLKENVNILSDYVFGFFSNRTKLSDILNNSDELSSSLYEAKVFSGTALNDAIIDVSNYVKQNINLYDAALINIYTDGEESHSKKSYLDAQNALSSLSEHNVTVTFIGTAGDVKNAIIKYKLDPSNTLVYDGTGKGIEKAMTETVFAKKEYMNNLSEGKNVRSGFYKNIK